MLEKPDNIHQDLVGFIWSVADKLRGSYRPPQYRRMMLPMIVLRRLDCVLEPTKKKVLAEKERLEAKGFTGNTLEKAISKAAVGQNRMQPFYNTFKFSLEEVLGDPDGIASNLVAYINGFSPQIREIFEKFDFEKEIDKLDESNRLYRGSLARFTRLLWCLGKRLRSLLCVAQEWTLAADSRTVAATGRCCRRV